MKSSKTLFGLTVLLLTGCGPPPAQQESIGGIRATNPSAEAVAAAEASMKDAFTKYLASKGYPLREVPHETNCIEYYFEVGPSYEYTIGVSFLETRQQREEFQPLDFAIPSHVHQGVVLWFWNVDTNGTPGYRELFEEVKAVVEQSPAKTFETDN